MSMAVNVARDSLMKALRLLGKYEDDHNKYQEDRQSLEDMRDLISDVLDQLCWTVKVDARLYGISDIEK